VPAVTPTAKIRKEKSNHLFMRGLLVSALGAGYF